MMASWLAAIPIALGAIAPFQPNPAHNDPVVNLQQKKSQLTLNLAQAAPDPGNQTRSACQSPALSRIVKHKVVAGETLESIAQRYSLIPATLIGLNPSLKGSKVAISSTLLIPPYNGIQVTIPAGQTWRDVAKRYSVRPDVLFEVNGCQANPRVVFVPGANWSPINTADSGTRQKARTILQGYPLVVPPARNRELRGYGWGLQSDVGQVIFHSGIDLAAPIGTSVLATGDGVVAFTGDRAAYGKLVVINHAEGLQTRYAQLNSIAVKTGQTVKRGQAIATVGSSGRPSSEQPHLHFEVRSRSNLGWVAEDPKAYLASEATNGRK